jgi:YrbI family 3-deoxy-D-manno-octulosonate 8-phosphate phosphatase
LNDEQSERAGHERVVVVIPARGGSRGVPGKNLAFVGGLTLVARAIASGLDARRVDTVVVSTDDDQIAAAARDAGATVVQRPDALSTDDASSESAVIDALDQLRSSGADDPEVTVLVQCTSPFLLPDDIDGVIGAVLDHGSDSALTVAPSHGFLWRTGPEGATGVNHDAVKRARRQELDPEYLETGAAYAMRTEGLRQSGHRFFGRTNLHVTDPARVLEIDEPADLERARALAPLLDAEMRSRRLPTDIALLLLDFDGVITDNRVMTSTDGSEGVTSDRSDGLGVELVRRAGVPVVVVSKEASDVVRRRCDKLGLECLSDVDDKSAVVRRYLEEHRVDPSTVVFVGNDVNDLPAFGVVGCAVAVADAHAEVKAAADVVLAARGGRGAVREICDLILSRLEAS